MECRGRCSIDCGNDANSMALMACTQNDAPRERGDRRRCPSRRSAAGSRSRWPGPAGGRPPVPVVASGGHQRHIARTACAADRTASATSHAGGTLRSHCPNARRRARRAAAAVYAVLEGHRSTPFHVSRPRETRGRIGRLALVSSLPTDDSMCQH